MSHFKVAVFETVDGERNAVAVVASEAAARDDAYHAAGALRVSPWQDVEPSNDFPWAVVGTAVCYLMLGVMLGLVFARYIG